MVQIQRESHMISIVKRQHRCIVDGEEVKLTPKEFGVLDALIDARGDVLDRGHLFLMVWNGGRPGKAPERSQRLVDLTICRLRGKVLGSPKSQRNGSLPCMLLFQAEYGGMGTIGPKTHPRGILGPNRGI